MPSVVAHDAPPISIIPGVEPNSLGISLTMPVMDAYETARRLRLMRAATGLTQDDFGRLINRRRATIGRWEDGEELPDDFVLAELASRAGFDRTFFVDDQPRLPTKDEAQTWRRDYEGAIARQAADEAAAAARAASGR